jgi:putative ABC transport system ATP-binding protein
MSTADGSVEIRDLVFGYGEGGFRLAVPRLEIGSGETVVLIGPSGSGKTTLLHLIAGILQPASGSVSVGGTAFGSLGPGARRRFRIERIGLVFQEFALLDHLSVRENIILPFLVDRGLARSRDPEPDLLRVAERCGIANLVGRRPEELSHGERQRVAICRALITRPALLLADEPTGNLDPTTTRRVVALLTEEVRARGTTLLMVTHDHSLIGSFDRVVDFESLAEVVA